MFVLAFVGLIADYSINASHVDSFIIYQIGFNDGRLSWIFYVAMILFTLFILVADFMMNKYFVNRFGGSKVGEYTALVGVIVGFLVFPPFGIILVPLIAVFVVELLNGFDFKKAFKGEFRLCCSFSS